MSLCEVYDCNHGSDHEAIHTIFSASLLPPKPTPRLLFKNAPWARICEQISSNIFRINASPDEVDDYTYQIMSVVTEAIDMHVPEAKACPYAKRWWTEDLSILRKNYARLRNQMSRRRQNGEDYSPRLDAQAWEAKNLYFKAIRCQKKKHWEEFLEDNDNIWQASKYLSDSNANPAFAPISGLIAADKEFVIKNDEIAATLLAKFFPPCK